MDGFGLIQQFFTRMRCHFCEAHLDPDGVELIRHDPGVFIVNVQCLHCTRQMGIALVGVETGDGSAPATEWLDPELTAEDLERFANREAIDYDDVVAAHKFFRDLDGDWQRYLPAEAFDLDLTPDESEAEAS